MDDFKRKQHDNACKWMGKGGYRCYCCGGPKTQEEKKQARRRARRRLHAEDNGNG